MKRSETTAKDLEQRKNRLQMDLANVNNLEKKIQAEMDELTTKISKMETELTQYNDLDGLKEVSQSTLLCPMILNT